jgi:hypothetical protein
MGGCKYFYPADTERRGTNTASGAAYIDSGSPENLGPFDVNTAGEHTKLTPDATVITMQQWHNMGSPIGSYWVIDTDGWAYWAAPILPGCATGLLLSSVREQNGAGLVDGQYYYAIHEHAEMASKDDSTGHENNYTQFGLEANGGWTEDGEELMDKVTESTEQITGIIMTTDSAMDGDVIYAAPGENITLAAYNSDGSTAVQWADEPSNDYFTCTTNGNVAVVNISENAPDGESFSVYAFSGGNAELYVDKTITVKS